VSRDITVMTGLDPVIHDQSSDFEGDGRRSGDFAVAASISVRL